MKKINLNWQHLGFVEYASGIEVYHASLFFKKDKFIQKRILDHSLDEYRHSNYFYELLAYAFEGNMAGRIQFPKRNAYSKVPYICRKLGVRDERVLKQLLKDEDFKKWATKKLNNSECRIIGIGEKRRRKKTDPVVYDVGSLEQFM